MKLVYCSANIYLLVYISHFLPIISCRHLKHTADKCTCAWEFKKPFIFCFITLRCIQAKINEQFKILADFKILAFQNPEFNILADFKIFSFHYPEFKILADFKILALKNPELQILADFTILAFQNPEL